VTPRNRKISALPARERSEFGILCACPAIAPVLPGPDPAVEFPGILITRVSEVHRFLYNERIV